MNIKKFLVGATIVMTAMSTMAELSARPMGGGKSIGRQSQSVNSMPKQAAPAPAPAAPTAAPAANRPGATPAAAPAQKPSMWKGLLGGALLGLGLGALLSSMGIGAGLASAIGTILTIALIGGVIFFIIAMIRRKSQPAMQPAAAFSGAGAGYNPQPQSQPQQQPMAFQPVQPAAAPAVAPVAPAAAAHTPWGVPADFDTAGFLRAAKSNYIRLQAAWDKADVEDIRTFTTPEVFAELRMQIQERGAQAEYTDVVTIDAELLGIENDGREYLASVKFWGTMKPAADALPESFQEVWNLSKPVNGSSGWMLAGIQQVA